MSTVRRVSPGTGVSEPVGSGKGSTIAVTHPGADSSTRPGVPGEVRYGAGAVRINEGRPVTTLRVANTGDRPITVGSHFHFAEANAALDFDRDAAWGKRLDIIAGGMVRFDPGVVREVELVPYAGDRIAAGFRGLCAGPLDAAGG
ncbi:urease subunit beta [Mycobacterium sp. M1]|uniref:Urease subunit beta n=1 Tax=Mycolicibacter acidiphilus TaxID=2835306 RepID=A0ABS5RHV2_9MYCO|nr:urease subunit beta [Mycolicibacter acidiphilus]MBS9533875.1 urease subunit beta [Mycolicibacter acidiphilus]